MAASSSSILFLIVVVVAHLHNSRANPLHVVIEKISDDGGDNNQEQLRSTLVRRRISLTDGRRLISFTKDDDDDDSTMADCSATNDPAAIRRILRRGNDDVITMAATYSDANGATFARWSQTCEISRRRDANSMAKRKVFPEIVYPGTLWCGPGDDADDYDDLGYLRETDKCCRRHDNCPVDILPFQTKYHYFNYRPWTVTHCTCDENLFNCLKKVGGDEKADSDEVGDVFFKEVNPPCFRLERGKYCSKKHWSHLWCDEYTWANDVAVIHDYLAGEWKKVNDTSEIANKPETQKIS